MQAGTAPRLAVDLPTGFARISYVAATTQKVRYAAYNGATWTIEDVDGIGQVGSYDATSLRLDSNGNPHISYYNATAGALMYASKTGASWVVDTVDTQGDVGGYSSLVLDDQDRPVISYYDATNQALKIAYGPGYGDGDGDGVPDAFDVCPGNPDCNGNGIVDGLEGGILQGVGGTRLRDERIDRSVHGRRRRGITAPAGSPLPARPGRISVAPSIPNREGATHVTRQKSCRNTHVLDRCRTRAHRPVRLRIGHGSK